MNRIFRALPVFFVFFFPTVGYCQSTRPDTLYVSAEHVVHLVCPSEITDVEVSNPDVVYSRVLDNNPNMVGLLAFEEFSVPTSLMVVDGTGKVYVFYLAFRDSPGELVRFVGRAAGAAAEPSASDGDTGQKDSKGELAQDMTLAMDAGQFRAGTISHIGKREFGVEVVCDRLYVQEDKLYFRFKVTNRSGISYEIDNVTFMVERRVSESGKKKAVLQRMEVPVIEEPSMRTDPLKTTYSVYVFNKFSLRKSERFFAFFNETDGTGTRAFELEFTPDDINRAVQRR